MEQVILVILAVGVVAVVLGILLKRLDVPPLVGYIFSGIILVNIVGSNEENSHILEQIAEFGIVFLMFTIGLEMSFDKIKKMKEILLVNGFLQVSISAILIYLVAFFIFKLSVEVSLIVSLAFSLSSIDKSTIPNCTPKRREAS